MIIELYDDDRKILTRFNSADIKDVILASEENRGWLLLDFWGVDENGSKGLYFIKAENINLVIDTESCLQSQVFAIPRNQDNIMCTLYKYDIGDDR